MLHRSCSGWKRMQTLSMCWWVSVYTKHEQCATCRFTSQIATLSHASIPITNLVLFTRVKCFVSMQWHRITNTIPKNFTKDGDYVPLCWPRNFCWTFTASNTELAYWYNLITFKDNYWTIKWYWNKDYLRMFFLYRIAYNLLVTAFIKFLYGNALLSRIA